MDTKVSSNSEAPAGMIPFNLEVAMAHPERIVFRGGTGNIVHCSYDRETDQVFAYMAGKRCVYVRDSKGKVPAPYTTDLFLTPAPDRDTPKGLIPFNLKEARKDPSRVVFRNGRPAKYTAFFHVPEAIEESRLLGIKDSGWSAGMYINGKFDRSPTRKNGSDLFLKPKDTLVDVWRLELIDKAKTRETNSPVLKSVYLAKEAFALYPASHNFDFNAPWEVFRAPHIVDRERSISSFIQ